MDVALPAAGLVRLSTDNDILLNEGQVSELVLMSVAWLRKRRYSGGGIPFVKMGKAVRYRRGDVLTWIGQMTVA